MDAKLKRDRDEYNTLLAEIPLRRMAKPEEIAGLCVFLPPHAGAYITGASYVIDGGMTKQSRKPIDGPAESKRGPGTNDKISRYDIADTEMAAGSTFGSPKATMIIKATGAIEKIYSGDIGLEMFGTVLVNHWDDRTGTRPLRDARHVSDSPGTSGASLPPHERRPGPRRYLRLERTTRTATRSIPRRAITLSSCTTIPRTPLEISTYAFAQLRGNTPRRYRTALTAANTVQSSRGIQDQEDLARVFGVERRADQLRSTSRITAERTRRYRPECWATRRSYRTATRWRRFTLHHRLKPGEYARFDFILSFSNRGRARRLADVRKMPQRGEARSQRTRDYYESVLNRAVVICPDENVNRGVLWAKANMLRTQTLSPTGWCFVNDPTRSNNSVARDTAWFALWRRLHHSRVQPELPALVRGASRKERDGCRILRYSKRQDGRLQSQHQRQYAATHSSAVASLQRERRCCVLKAHLPARESRRPATSFHSATSRAWSGATPTERRIGESSAGATSSGTTVCPARRPK